MAKKKRLNVLTDTPESLSDLTLDFMYDYIKLKGKKADKEWYAGVVSDLWGKKYNNLEKAEIDGITDIPALRKQFAERFFPNLNNRKKKKDEESYLDKVKGLLK